MQPRLLHGFLERCAREHPGRVAIEVPPTKTRPRWSLTYAELDHRSDELAARLAPEAAEDRVFVILLSRDTPAPFVAQLAVLKAGAAFTCIDPAFPDRHARTVIEDCDATAVLTEPEGLARAVSLGVPRDRTLDVTSIAGSSCGPAPRSAPPRSISPSSLAYVIYTSGTTGRPKGVMVEHRSIANLVGSDLERFRLTPEDRVAQSSSLAYDSSLEEIWLALACGATLVVLSDEAARLGPDLVPLLRRERITVLCPPPTLLRSTGCRDPRSALPDLRLLYVGGEPLPQDLADRWARGRWLENGYGPTECTVTVVRGRIEPGAPVVIGREVRGHRAWVLDEDLREVPAGESGELCVGGPGLARGYHHRPDLTEERFVAHPRLGRVYRTGDLVRRNEGGDLVHLGRIDAQVKLRGYRVELSAIESRLVECDGVREAACTVQEESGRQVLVAYVVPDAPREPPRFEDLRRSLEGSLPGYMVPARYGVIERLPVTVGGKLRRDALPRIDAPVRATGRVSPRDATEKAIARAFGAALGREGEVSVEDDFFLDLSGDSLAAATVVSSLRGDPATAMLTVRDLYELRTVEKLAARARTGTMSEGACERATAGPRGKPRLVTAIQAGWLLAELLALAALLHVTIFVGLAWLIPALGLTLTVIAVPLLVLAGTILYAPAALGVATLAKRLLIGAYRPTIAPAWGSFHLRHWILCRITRLLPWWLFRGTVLTSVALRVLGARVGRRVHVHRGVDLSGGGWDLLDIGDDATLAQDAAVRLVDIEDGQLLVGPVAIGARSTIDVRAGLSGHTSVGSGAWVTAHSWLPSGSSVPDGERWDGVPAEPAGAAPGPPSGVEGRSVSPALHAALLILARSVAGCVLSLPLVVLLAATSAALGLDLTARLAAMLSGRSVDLGALTHLLAVVLVAIPLALVEHALFLRLLGRVRDGTIGRWSLGYLRVSIKSEGVSLAGQWLSGTVFWPGWLRLAGMRVGRNCEISTVIDVVPELVTIGEECFLADGIYLGGPGIQAGTVTLAPTELGGGTFLGNHAVIPAGARLPEGVLVGVCTVTDGTALHPHGAWFGHPPFELPRRGEPDMDRRLTYAPGLARRLTRIFWETLRFALPVPGAALAVAWLALVARSPADASASTVIACTAAATLAVAAGACAMVLSLKWILLGRVKPGRHPLWSCWCSRWDFLYVAWGFYARGVLASLEGTLLLAWYLRAMGARVGRRVLLGSGFAQVVDPDMLCFEDRTTVNGLFQAHTFEDRVLKIDRVSVRRRATVGAAAVLFYGADIGAGARVAPHGVVMKGERLLPHRRYTGCPTAPEG